MILVSSNNIRIIEETKHGVVRMAISGTLQREDYEAFVPLIERLIATHGKVHLMIEFENFHGWTPGALWEDIKFDVKHFHDIERLALVGDKTWEHGLATFCTPFTAAEVRFFDLSDSDLALRWTESGEEG